MTLFRFVLKYVFNLHQFFDFGDEKPPMKNMFEKTRSKFILEQAVKEKMTNSRAL